MVSFVLFFLAAALSGLVRGDVERYALQFGTRGDDNFYGACIDSNNNVYGVGISNFVDFQIVKMSSTGAFIKNFVSPKAYLKKPRYVDDSDCVVDSNDRINVVVRFDGASLGGIQNVWGEEVAFLIQFDTNLKIINSIYVSKSSAKNGHSIAVDNKNFIYIAGSIYSETAGYDMCIIEKFTPDCQVLEVKTFGLMEGGSLHHCTNLAVDSANDLVFVSGYSDFADSNRIMVITKFRGSNFSQRSGTYQIKAPYGSHDNVVGLTLDSQGNVYASGVSATESEAQAWISKYNGKSVSEIWGRDFGFTNANIMRDLQVNGDDVYGVGFTTLDVFEGYTIPNHVANTRAVSYVRLSKEDGTTQFASGYGSSLGADYANAVVMDSFGNAIAAGWSGGNMGSNKSKGGQDFFMFSYRND